jgi:hypothetical protein
MDDRSKFGQRFLIITTLIFGLSALVCALVIADSSIGLSLGFTSRDIPTALFAVAVSLFIRVFGVWLIRLTGGFK